MPGSESVLTAPGAPPSSGKGAPAKSGRKLPQTDCPQRKAPPGPGNRSSAPLPCRFFRPAGQRTGFGHSRSTAPSGKGAPAKAGRELPQTDYPQRKAPPGPGSRSSAPLPCRFFHPAGQRAGFGHSRGAASLGEGCPGQIGPETPPGRLSVAEGSVRPGQRSSAPLPCRFFHPTGQRVGFGHPRDITFVQADGCQAKADPELPPAGHLPQRALPDPGNRPPAPLPVYPPCRAANRARAGDAQAGVALNRLLDQLSAAADPAGLSQSVFFPLTGG